MSQPPAVQSKSLGLHDCNEERRAFVLGRPHSETACSPPSNFKNDEPAAPEEVKHWSPSDVKAPREESHVGLLTVLDKLSELESKIEALTGLVERKKSPRFQNAVDFDPGSFISSTPHALGNLDSIIFEGVKEENISDVPEKKYMLMLTPNSAVRTSWDLLVLIPCLVYILFVLPYRLCFKHQAK
jgi:hypothetical protein